MAVAIVGGGLWWWRSGRDERDARRRLPAILALAERGDAAAFYRDARTVVARLPDEPRLQQRWTDLTIPVSISSQPEGADVSVKGYSDAEDGWISIGRTPLAQARLPVGTTRIRVSKEGYAPFDGTVLGVAMTFALDPVATVPEGMIHMPGGTTSIEGRERNLQRLLDGSV